MKEDFKITKVEYQSRDLSKGGTWCRRRHLKKKPPRAPENGITRKERKRKEKVVVTVEKQEHTLQDESAQHTDNSV